MRRAEMLAHVKKGQVIAMHNHDVHAHVFGTIAYVQGMDDETDMMNGKATAMRYTWLDVFQKRGGHWVAIASQTTPVPK